MRFSVCMVLLRLEQSHMPVSRSDSNICCIVQRAMNGRKHMMSQLLLEFLYFQ